MKFLKIFEVTKMIVLIDLLFLLNHVDNKALNFLLLTIVKL